MASSGKKCPYQQRAASTCGDITEAFKVLRYKLIADDGSGRRLIQFALPGREFETTEALEAEGLIKREFMRGERSAPKVPRDTRVTTWKIDANEQVKYTADAADWT